MYNSSEVGLNLIPNTLSNSPLKQPNQINMHFPKGQGHSPTVKDIPPVKSGGIRRWSVKIRLDTGVPIERVIRLKDIKKEFDDAKGRGKKRKTMPLLPWVIDFIIHNHNPKLGAIESFIVEPYRRFQQ